MSKAVASVPVIMQMEATECGAASLAMVLAVLRAIGSLQEMLGNTPLFRAQASVLKQELLRDIAQCLWANPLVAPVAYEHARNDYIS